MNLSNKILGAAIASAICLPSALWAQPSKKMFKVKGEIVDLHCFLDDGSRGPKHKACAVTCAKAGNPIGIVDGQGRVYVLMGEKQHDPDTKALIAKMAETVTVTGKLAKRGGTQVIYVHSIK